MKQNIDALNLRKIDCFKNYFQLGDEGDYNYDRLAFYGVITNCHYNFGMNYELMKFYKDNYDCGIISPLTEYLFEDKWGLKGKLNRNQETMKELYTMFRNNDLSDTIYEKCKGDIKFMDQFLVMAWYLHITKKYLSMELHLVT